MNNGLLQQIPGFVAMPYQLLGAPRQFAMPQQFGIVRENLVLDLDAGNPESYPKGGLLWRDLSGRGHNGTLTNGPTYSSANGGSIVFDGTNDYNNIPYSSIFNIQQFTLNVWFRYISFTGFDSLITNPQTGTSPDSSWSAPYLSWMLRVNNGNQVEIGIGSASTYYSSTYSYTFSLGTIYNMCATYDSSNLLLYINGSLVYRRSLSVTINYTSKPVVLAADYGKGYSNCSIFNANVYNRALSPSEVQQNFNSLRPRFGI